jgi:hypothetical protein
MSRIEELFNKYPKDYEVSITPATDEQIAIFVNNCKKYDIPETIKAELVEYYRLNNNFFNYFTCDDSMLFEWFDEDNCLWLGQRDLWTFRCLVGRHKYSIGDAGYHSFSPHHEFDTIEEMLEAFLSGQAI